jgi:hypothetical protein
MAVSSPSSAPEKKRKWLLSNRKVSCRFPSSSCALHPMFLGAQELAVLFLVLHECQDLAL